MPDGSPPHALWWDGHAVFLTPLPTLCQACSTPAHVASHAHRAITTLVFRVALVPEGAPLPDTHIASLSSALRGDPALLLFDKYCIYLKNSVCLNSLIEMLLSHTSPAMPLYELAR